jgi:hypothetical protein
MACHDKIRYFARQLLGHIGCMLYSNITKHLSTPLVKMHCNMLVIDVIKAIVKDYRQKKSFLWRHMSMLRQLHGHNLMSSVSKAC